MGGTVGERLGGTEWARKNERIQAQAEEYNQRKVREADESSRGWRHAAHKNVEHHVNAAGKFATQNVLGEVGKFVERNTRSLMPGDNSSDEEVLTSTANYTASSGTQKSSSGGKGGGKLTSTSKKKGRGKKDLTITKS